MTNIGCALKHLCNQNCWDSGNVNIKKLHKNSWPWDGSETKDVWHGQFQTVTVAVLVIELPRSLLTQTSQSSGSIVNSSRAVDPGTVAVSRRRRR